MATGLANIIDTDTHGTRYIVKPLNHGEGVCPSPRTRCCEFAAPLKCLCLAFTLIWLLALLALERMKAVAQGMHTRAHSVDALRPAAPAPAPAPD